MGAAVTRATSDIAVRLRLADGQLRTTPPPRFLGIDARLVTIPTTALLALVSAVPLQLSGLATVTPQLVLIALFHWTLYVPQALPYWVLFLLGVVIDLLTSVEGASFGLSALVLLLARWVLLHNRRRFVGQGFPILWAGFAVLAAAAALLTWSVTSLFTLRVIDPRAFLFQTLLTVALFPPVTRVLAWLQRALPNG